MWAWARGPYPTLVSRVVLGLVFLVFGATKIPDPVAFEQNIAAYQMVPDAVARLMAYGLPWFEVLLGLYLLAGLYLRLSAVISGALLIVFMIAMGQALARGLTLQCGCVGGALGNALKEDVSIWSILRDGVFLLLAVHLAFVPSVWTLEARLRPQQSGGGAAQDPLTLERVAAWLPGRSRQAYGTGAVPAGTRRRAGRSGGGRRR